MSTLSETRAASEALTPAAPPARPGLLHRREFGTLAGLLALCVALWIATPHFLTVSNLVNVLEQSAIIGIVAVGMTFVILTAGIDLSVGSIVALSGVAMGTAFRAGLPIFGAAATGLAVGLACGLANGAFITLGRLPPFIATLGMFYIARGTAAWIVAGKQLTGFPESFNLLGRKLYDIFAYLHIPMPEGLARTISEVVSVQTIWMIAVAVVAGVVLAYTPFGQKVYATGGNIRAAAYAGINTNRVRFTALMLSALCATMAGIINVAYFRSFNPVAGQFRELDAIAAVIIGGGSIFGGYGTMIGALAGAGVITLVRALLQLNVQGFTMPQHWISVFIGAILILAVLIDIWVRQANLFGRLRARRARRLRTAEATDA